MTIRNVTRDDAFTLKKIASQCYPLETHTSSTYWVLCEYFGDSCFIILDEERPVGFITAIQNSDWIFIWQIGILSWYRGGGLSSRLLDAEVELADKLNKKLAVAVPRRHLSAYNLLLQYCKKNGLVFEELDEAKIEKTDNPEDFEKNVIYKLSRQED